MKASIAVSSLAVSLLTSGLTGLLQSPANASETKIDQLLIQHGLVPTKLCNGGVVSIWVSLDKSPVCAIPNGQYTAGAYRLTSDLKIVAIAGDKQEPKPSVTQPPTTVVQPPTSVMPPTTVVQPPMIVAPSVIFTANPSQPVSPAIGAQIGASLSGKGLTLASCSANPGVVVMMGSYMACAYSTDIYPAGRYSLSF